MGIKMTKFKPKSRVESPWTFFRVTGKLKENTTDKQNTLSNSSQENFSNPIIKQEIGKNLTDNEIRE